MNYNFGGNVLEEEVGGGGGEGSRPWARPCDGCRAAPSVVYCRADAAYLCASCDTRVHSANRVASRHERVRVCEACERAPAVLTCRADAAALCAACDAKVHSANPLAGRHQRVPVVPLPAAALPAASVLAEAAATTVAIGDKEEEVDSWLLLGKDSDNNNSSSNNISNSNSNNNINSNKVYFAEVDEYFDLVGYNSYCDNHINNDPEQYGMQEQQQQQLMQKEFGDKEADIFLINGGGYSTRQHGHRHGKLQHPDTCRSHQSLLRSFTSDATSLQLHGQRGQGPKVQGEEEE
ncbi:unnamed protein product [Urochloa decumbens]|uniref:B box-type domain-containing protein n=1 Tax=Urochloa decumbens TaxID=240449 RepID=A0ABC9DQT4_9POAL